jgi:hypothetical protein
MFISSDAAKNKPKQTQFQTGPAISINNSSRQPPKKFHRQPPKISPKILTKTYIFLKQNLTHLRINLARLVRGSTPINDAVPPRLKAYPGLMAYKKQPFGRLLKLNSDPDIPVLEHTFAFNSDNFAALNSCKSPFFFC